MKEEKPIEKKKLTCSVIFYQVITLLYFLQLNFGYYFSFFKIEKESWIKVMTSFLNNLIS